MTAGGVSFAHRGGILKIERFRDCVRFCRDMFGLPLWWEKPGLVCLGFGTGYLMVEGLGRAAPGGKSCGPAEVWADA